MMKGKANLKSSNALPSSSLKLHIKDTFCINFPVMDVSEAHQLSIDMSNDCRYSPGLRLLFSGHIGHRSNVVSHKHSSVHQPLDFPSG